jgi:hypothetical protein
MIRKRVTWVAAALVSAVLSAGACSTSDDGTGPSGPGQITVSVSSASSGSAFLLTLTGQGISNVAAVNGNHRIYSFAQSNTSQKVAVIGSLSSGDLLRFNVSDIGASYNATLSEVAGADNNLLPTGDFQVTVGQ